MSYYGGLGAGRGWHKFKFILRPETLEKVFENINFWFVITNTRVDINYELSRETSFFNDYAAFLSRIISGKDWNRKEDWTFENSIRISLINDPKTIIFEDIKNRKGEVSTEYKVVRPTEPVVNVSPFYLYLQNEKLSIETSNDEGILGLELSYPKVVSFGSEGHEYLYETDQFSGHDLFLELTNRIKKVSHKAKLSGLKKTYRPNFWVDNIVPDEINNHSYLKKKRLALK